MSQWYYGSSAGQQGPVEEQELRRLIQEGQVGPESLVLQDGMAEWQPLSSMPQFSQQQMLPYQSPQSQTPGYPYGYATPMGPTSGLAIASMVCGIVGIMTCYFASLLGIPAVICGHMALSQIRASPYPMPGRGMAIAGLVMGYLWIGLTIIGLIFAIFAFAGTRP